MSWDCPYWVDDICRLNGIACKPGKGQCVLKGRYQIKSGKKDNEEEKEEKGDSNLQPSRGTFIMRPMNTKFKRYKAQYIVSGK